MTRGRLSGIAVAVAATLTALAILSEPAGLAQVYRPNPSPTAKADTATMLGVPKPAASPNCTAKVGVFGDVDPGCLYACSNAGVTVLAGVACVAFATPTPTVTATPTPTVTPTPTPTAT